MIAIRVIARESVRERECERERERVTRDGDDDVPHHLWRER